MLKNTDEDANISKKPKITNKKVVEKPTQDNDAGAKIYNEYCTICHAAGLAGAPKFKDKTDWSQRISQKNIDDLVKSAINGLNAMPPKGTCQSCTELELKKAIEYMVP